MDISPTKARLNWDGKSANITTDFMKRSVINKLIRSAEKCFREHHWALPPDPEWDVTDFGLGDPARFGLVLVNLAREKEYWEKLMYAREGMETPAHTHRQKKEDIICRWGRLQVRVWPGPPDDSQGRRFHVQVNGLVREVQAGDTVELSAGERITLTPGIYHSFVPASEECVIGEVSTWNDDATDNYFVDPNIGRFPGVEEDEPPLVKLVNDE